MAFFYRETRFCYTVYVLITDRLNFEALFTLRNSPMTHCCQAYPYRRSIVIRPRFYSYLGDVFLSTKGDVTMSK